MQEIDLNKANWNALFEPFHFFEAYRKFLVVDIVADDDDDLRLWKGWVESRLRQLTLKVHFHRVRLVEAAPALQYFPLTQLQLQPPATSQATVFFSHTTPAPASSSSLPNGLYIRGTSMSQWSSWTHMSRFNQSRGFKRLGCFAFA